MLSYQDYSILQYPLYLPNEASQRISQRFPDYQNPVSKTKKCSLQLLLLFIHYSYKTTHPFEKEEVYRRML